MRVLSSKAITQILPFAILLVLSTLWGGVPSIAKYIGQSGITPLSYSTWVLSIAACSILAINFARVRRLPPRHIVFYIICGLSGTALPTTMMYFSLQAVPASLMSILIASAPIFTFILALAARAEAYHHLKTLGLALGFGGMALILLPKSATDLQTPVGWILLGALTPFLYAVNTVYTTLFRPANLHVIDLATGMISSAAIAMLLVTISAEPLYPLWEAEPLILGLTLYHGILTAVALTLFYTLLKIAGPVFTIQVAYPITIMGIAFGYLIHAEVLPAMVWLATVLMLAGVGLIGKARLLLAEQS